MNRGRASSTSADRTGGHKKDNARSVSAPPAPPSFRVSRGRGTGKLRTRLDLHGLKIIEYSLVGSEAAGGIWEILQAKDARLGNTRSIIELYARIDFAKNPSPLILAKRMLARGQVVPFTFGYTQKPKAPGVLDPRVAIEISAEIFYNGRATYAICVEHQEVALQCDQDFTLVNKVMSAIREGKKGEAATWLLRREAPIPVHISYFGSRLENLDLDMTTVNRQYRNYLSQPSISFTPPPGACGMSTLASNCACKPHVCCSQQRTVVLLASNASGTPSLVTEGRRVGRLPSLWSVPRKAYGAERSAAR